VSDQEKSFTDWGKQALSKSENGKRIIISEQVDTLRSRGFTAEETLDILVSKDFDNMSLIEEVVDKKFGKTSSTNKKSIKKAFVCPTSYSEIKNNIAEQLNKLGPVNFVNKLARSENPIMPVNDKAYNSYLRLASDAFKNNDSSDRLNNELKKWFEEAIYVSICAAKSNKNEIRIASKNNNYVASNGKHDYEVNLKNGTCTCPKFTKSHYGDFGLACEHIVAASEKASPHQWLLKAVKASDSSAEISEQLFMFDSRVVMRS